MTTSSNSSTQNQQSWFGGLASLGYRCTIGPVVDCTCFAGRKIYGAGSTVAGAAVGTYNFAATKCSTAYSAGKVVLGTENQVPVVEDALERFGIEKLLVDTFGETKTRIGLNLTAKAINSWIPDKIIYYNGLDLNPFHLRPKKTEAPAPEKPDDTTSASKSKQTPEECATVTNPETVFEVSTEQPIPSSEFIPGVPTEMIPVEEKALPIQMTPVHTGPAPASPVAIAPQMPLTTDIQKSIQEELTEENVKKYKDKAKEHAGKELIPVITNYARAYWLFTSIMGNTLSGEAAKNNNQVLMDVVKSLRENHQNNFTLKHFISILQTHGINVSFWQKIKLYTIYPLLGSWITKLLVPSLCNKGIDLIYDQLFGQQGKNQGEFLSKGMEELSKFLDKYANLLEQYYDCKTTKTTQKDFIADIIQSEDWSKMYSEFASVIIGNFLPSIGKNLIQPEIDRLARYAKINENSSFLAKTLFFVGTLPLRLLKWLGWIIDTTVKKITYSLIKDIGPTIVENTILSLQGPITQMNLKETLLEVLTDLQKDLQNSLTNPSAENETASVLPFASANKSNVHRHLPKLAESLSKILSLKSPDIKVDADTILEELIQKLNTFDNLGETLIKDKVISNALVQVIPEVCLTVLSKYLHPKQFTEEVVTKLIDTTTLGFAPTPPFDEAAQAKSKQIDEKLKQACEDLSILTIETAMKTVIDKKVLPLITANYECPKVDKDKVPKEQLFDVTEVVKKSFVPRIKAKYMQEGLNCIFDENIQKYGVLHVMNIVNSVFS